MSFPSLVGGAPLPSDFAPSVVFAIVHGLLCPLVAYRTFSRRSRTWVTFGVSFWVLERVVFFALRAVQSQRESWRDEGYVTIYNQIALAFGSVGVTYDLLVLLRCMLVNPTFGAATYCQSPAADTKDCFLPPPPPGEPDRPSERRRVRTFSAWLTLISLVPWALAIAAYWWYNDALRDHELSSRIFSQEYARRVNWRAQSTMDRNFSCRLASTGSNLVLLIIILASAVWSLLKQHRVDRRSAHIIAAASVLLSIANIYRFVVMFNKTTSFASTEPGSLSSPGDKAAFYILHIVPELFASAIILAFDARKTFGTGPRGDARSKDLNQEQMVALEQMRLVHQASKSRP